METIDKVSGNGVSSSPNMEAAMVNSATSGLLSRLFADYAAKALLSLDSRDKGLAKTLAIHLDSCKVDSVRIMAHRYLAGELPVAKKDNSDEMNTGSGLKQLRSSLKRHDLAAVSALHALLLAPRQKRLDDDAVSDNPSVKNVISGLQRIDSTMMVPKNLLFLQNLIEKEAGDEMVTQLYELLALAPQDSQIDIVNAIADAAPNDIRQALPQFILNHGNMSLMPAFEKMLRSGDNPSDMVATAWVIQRFGGADKVARLRRVMLDSYSAILITAILIIDLLSQGNKGT
jgi:hypothetical protein